jgi:hypothetical protein
VIVSLTFAEADAPADRWDVTLEEHSDQRLWGRRVGQLQPRHDHSDPFVFADVPAGRHAVLARREGYPTFRDVLEVAPGDARRSAGLTIPALAGTISGTLAFREERTPPTLLLQRDDRQVMALVEPDANGAFEFAHLPPGDYTLSRAPVASDRGAPLAPVHLEPGEHEVVHLHADAPEEKGYLVVLVVTDAGTPLATPDVWLERDGRVIDPHYDNDDGKSFAGAPGAYTLHAQYSGYRSVRKAVTMKSKENRSWQEILEPLVITMARQ